MTATTNNATSIVQNLCKLSNKIFSTFIKTNGSNCSTRILDDHNVSRLKNLFSQLTLNDINYDLNALSNDGGNNQAPIAYTSIYENEYFSLTVFGFRHPRSFIPLHDHPFMHGFIKCLYGSISVKSYTKISDNTNLLIPEKILEKVRKSDYNSIVPCIYNGECIIGSCQNNDSHKLGSYTQDNNNDNNDQIGFLNPIDRNIHEIKPLTTSAVMIDIISPPYTQNTDNYFYNYLDTIYDKTLDQNVSWLFKTITNNDYYCDTIPYNGPNIQL